MGMSTDTDGAENEHGYLLDNQQSEAGVRFGALAELFDPVTFRHVDRIGLTEGMRCWEVGAGGPSVPTGLAERVGPTRQVVCADIDVSWAREAASPVVEVLRHDVATDPPPPGGFDLVHARLVLVHVVDRAEALRRMVRALRPVGCCSLRTPIRGSSPCCARTSPAPGSGSPTGLRADAYFPITSPACTVLEAATVRQIRGRLVAAGIATDADIDRHLANVATGQLDLATAPLVSAWGRRAP
ncbi:class I SAM-dependent methyltransferase [Streptomyces sp. NPDC021093]|uniref:class I SAM-dependent methyltransferase n=1 Tax=Streptomyces sp. NPDC021093 TaxID=3365112 RepID=UPI0037A0DD92